MWNHSYGKMLRLSNCPLNAFLLKNINQWEYFLGLNVWALEGKCFCFLLCCWIPFYSFRRRKSVNCKRFKGILSCVFTEFYTICKRERFHKKERFNDKNHRPTQLTTRKALFIVFLSLTLSVKQAAVSILTSKEELANGKEISIQNSRFNKQPKRTLKNCLKQTRIQLHIPSTLLLYETFF